MNDEQLREHFAQWASPLRAVAPPTVGVIQRRARRRTIRLAAAASSAVATAALACLAIVAIAMSGGHGALNNRPDVVGGIRHKPGELWGSARYPAPPGAPYLVTIGGGSRGAQLRDEATGTVLKTLRPLVPGDDFTWVAAASTDRLFVLAEQSANRHITFAELQISPAGRPEPLRQLMPAVSISAQIYGLAVSPDGNQLALSTMPLAGNGDQSVLVYNLKAGAGTLQGEWTSSDPGAVSLSFGPGHELAMGWQDSTGAAPDGLRILDTATGAGARKLSLLADSSMAASVPHFYSANLTSDGATVLAVTAGAKEIELEEISAHSGKVLTTVPIGPASALQTMYVCGVLWASPTGTSAITQCGDKQQLLVNGKATPTRLAWVIPASVVGNANTLAWSATSP